MYRRSYKTYEDALEYHLLEDLKELDFGQWEVDNVIYHWTLRLEDFKLEKDGVYPFYFFSVFAYEENTWYSEKTYNTRGVYKDEYR